MLSFRRPWASVDTSQINIKMATNYYSPSGQKQLGVDKQLGADKQLGVDKQLGADKQLGVEKQLGADYCTYVSVRICICRRVYLYNRGGLKVG